MDIQILLFLQKIREALGGSLNEFFVFISNIGVDYFILVPALILFWCIDKKKGTKVLFSWGSSLCLGAFLKATFCVYRPWIKDSRIQPPAEIFAGATGYSFPSGHSFSSGGFWNSLAIIYKKNRRFMWFCIIMVALTMFSRIFLGVHTPQDVLVGCAITWLCAFGMCRLFDALEEHSQYDWIVVVAAAVISAALLCYLKFKSYPMDYVDGKLLVNPKKMCVDGFKDPGLFFGIVLGWFVEKKFINFETEGTTEQKVLRALIGGLLTVFWYTAIACPVGKAVDVGIVYFIMQATTPLLFMTIYPLIFRAIEKRNKTDV